VVGGCRARPFSSRTVLSCLPRSSRRSVDRQSQSCTPHSRPPPRLLCIAEPLTKRLIDPRDVEETPIEVFANRFSPTRFWLTGAAPGTVIIATMADSTDRRNTIFVGHRARPETSLAASQFSTMLHGPTWTSIAPCSVSSRTSRRCAPVPQAASWTRPARGALPEAGRLQGMVLLISPRNAIWILGPDRRHRNHANIPF